MSSTITNPSSKLRTIESDLVKDSTPIFDEESYRNKQSVKDMTLTEYIRRGPGKGVGITEPLYSEDQRKISRR
jgi:Txe/YoeB family toxin of Txe-Axe toxin-antitoxin module